MSVRLTWFCCFFLALQVNNSRADVYGVPGGNVTMSCFYRRDGAWRFFCREKCEAGNVLLQTQRLDAQSGRYRVRYSSALGRVLTAAISELTRSDSGLYRLALGKSSSSQSEVCDFRLHLVEALLDGSKDHHLYKEAGSSLTVACSFGFFGSLRTGQLCRGRCRENILIRTNGRRADGGRYIILYESGVLYVSIIQLTQSDSGWYRCSLDRNDGSYVFRDFNITVTDAVDPTSSTPTSTQSFSSTSPSSLNLLLVVGSALTIVIIILSVVLLVWCRRRSAAAQQGPAVQTENAADSPAVDNFAKVAYAEVKFFKRTSPQPDALVPPVRASGVTNNDVVYATVQMTDLNQSKEEPLYSNTAQM